MKLGPLSILIGLLVASSALAQESPEKLRADLDDALQQLQAAQDRKNQLANENDQLKRTLAELQGRLLEAQRLADQALALREHHAAWLRYVDAFPELGRAFEASFPYEAGLPRADIDWLYDPQWPFGAMQPR